MQNITEDMKRILDDNGKLPQWAWPGGYPMFYLDGENNVLCTKCANENDEFSSPISACDANWEDPDMYCDHCSTRIESAYAED